MTEPLTLEQSKTLFLEYLRHERSLSEETCRAYAGDLEQFHRYLQKKTCTESIRISAAVVP